MLIKNNQIALLKHWIEKKNDFLEDFAIFWNQINWWNSLTVIGSLIISTALFLGINYKTIFKFKSKDKKDNNDLPWEYHSLYKEQSKLSKEKFIKNFSSNEPGFILGYLKHEKKYIVNQKKDVHACVLGITGSGKSERIIIPNIYRNSNLEESQKPCFVITDPKKQILQRTGNQLEQNGYDVIVFDLANSNTSIKWNPLQEVWDIFHNKKIKSKETYAKGFELINEIVNSLPFPDSDKNSIWINNSKNIITSILKFLVLYSITEDGNDFKVENYNLNSVIEYLSIQNFKSNEWFKVVEKHKQVDQYWLKLYNDIRVHRETPDETLGGYMSNAVNALSNITNDIHLQTIISNSSLKLSELFENDKPFAIFICYSDHKETTHYIIPMILSSIYRQAIDKANENEKKQLKRPLQFLVEEFGSLPKINGFVNWITIARSRRIFFMLVMQDYSQLKKYETGANESNIIKTQLGLTIFLDTNDESTLKSISELLGTKTIEKTSKTISDKNTSKTISESQEKVMEVRDLLFRDSSLAIIISQKTKPIALKTTLAIEYINDNYYEQEQIYEPLSSSGWDFMKMQRFYFNNSLSQQENIDSIGKNNETIVKEEIKNKVVKKDQITVVNNEYLLSPRLQELINNDQTAFIRFIDFDNVEQDQNI